MRAVCFDTDCFDVATYQPPFRGKPVTGQRPEGATVADIVRDAGIEPRFLMDVQVVISRGVNLSVVPMDAWGRVRPRAGSHVLVTPKIHGAALGVILSAVLPTAATFVAGSLFAAGTVGFALTVAAVTIVGALAVNALIPPPARPEQVKQDDPKFSITGASNVLSSATGCVRLTRT